MKLSEQLKQTTNKSVISQLKPCPISVQIQKISELRASDSFTDIQIKSRAPKGKYCDNCENLTTKYEPRICSWNGEITDIVSFSYCSFFNYQLNEEKQNECCTRCIKCLSCMAQTSKD